MSEVEERAAEGLRVNGLPEQWARVGIIFEDQYLLVLRDAVRFPDGTEGTYIRVIPRHDQAPGVVVLPLQDGKIALVRHFRHATRDWHLEIPRGFGTPGLSVRAQAEAELREEIGAVIKTWQALGRMHVNTGVTSELGQLAVAEVEGARMVDGQEAISETLLVTPAELERMIRDDEITDSFTIAAYARAKLRGII